MTTLVAYRKMNPEVKAKLLPMLRSGDYRQATGTFHYHDADGDRYCVLGMICLAAGLPPNNDDGCGQWTDVREILNTDNGGTEKLLYSMNDEAKKTFSELADWIEANL